MPDRSFLHDAFISYSRKNRDFAVVLEKALEGYRPPRGLGLPERHLDVFRDEADFTGVEYNKSVGDHLKASAKLIVLCSPEARQSPYVDDEVRRFARDNGADNIIPVLLSGLPNNEARPGQDAEMAFPAALCEALEIPLAVNYRSFRAGKDRADRGAFEGPWYSVLANLYGVSRSVIEERDRKRQARRRRLTAGAVTTIIALLSTALVVALLSRKQALVDRKRAEDSRDEAQKSAEAERTAKELEQKAHEEETRQRTRADERTRTALSRQLAADALNQLSEDRIDLALLLSLEAQRIDASTMESRSSLLSGLAYSPRLETYLRNDRTVERLAFSPDGKTLVAAAGSRVVFWDVARRRPSRAPLSDHGDAVFGVAFSPDGKQLASGSRSDKNLILWDLGGARPVAHPLTGQDGAIPGIAFSPDGRTLATAGGNSKIVLWDVASLRARAEPLADHGSFVSAVVFSPDGTRLVSGGQDGFVVLWDAVTGKRLGQAGERGAQVECVAFSPDGKHVAFSGGRRTVTLWDPATGEEVPLEGHTGTVEGVAFSPDGGLLASSSDDRSVILWDVAKRARLGPALRGHRSHVKSVAFSPDGSRLASGDADGNILFWDMTRPQRLGRWLTGHVGVVNSLAFSPNGKTLASGGCGKRREGSQPCEGEVRLWNVARARRMGQPLTGHTGPVLGLGFTAGGRLRSGSCATMDGNYCKGIEVRSWDGATGTPLGAPRTAATPWNNLNRLSFAPGADRMAAGSARGPSTGSTGEALVWGFLKEGALGLPLAGNQGSIDGLVFSPDGRVLATSGEDTLLWEVDAGRPLGPPFAATEVAFSPDGTRLAAFDKDTRTIVLRDAATARPAGPSLTVAADRVFSMAFSPDGRTLAWSGFDPAGVTDGTITLWDLATGQPLRQTLNGHTGLVRALAFSPDGLALASGAADATVVLWDVSVASWRREACRVANRNLTYGEWTHYLEGEPYQATCADLPVDVAGLIASGRERSGAGDLTGAAALFRRARELDPKTALDPDREALRSAGAARLAEGEYLARAGHVDRAVALLQGALELDPSLTLDPKARAGRLAAPVRVTDGRRLVKAGKIAEAIAAFDEARRLDPAIEVSADAWDELCRFGALWDHARQVLDACQRAVKSAPKDRGFRDSRGLARALSGDRKGAAEDFQAFVEATTASLSRRMGLEERQRRQAEIAERQAWIAELAAGRNPITREVIASLRAGLKTVEE